MENLNVNITTKYIKLYQLLKFSGVAETGAEAKDIIYSNMVFFNGEPCVQRGKKVRAGDSVTIEFDDETVNITVSTE